VEHHRLLLFLEGAGPNGDGRFIDEVLALDDTQIEHVHTFIQWLFPLDEPSRAQPQSPVLLEGEAELIRQSNLAQQNLVMATERMLAFYRLNRHWHGRFDHNHLRISRIIASLRLLLGEFAAAMFLREIETLVEKGGNLVSAESRKYWRRALDGP
jgi:hypothetical protein